MFEDDVVINAVNRTYIESVMQEHPNDHVIRFDCRGKSCRASTRVRNCWCGGTHMVLYRLSQFKRPIKTFYEHNIGAIDCILEGHANSICINEGVVSTKPMEGDIPKTT